jgi:hypothetical protein
LRRARKPLVDENGEPAAKESTAVDGATPTADDGQDES